ncbi:MAG: S8 family serine peptidase [Holophagales bacterium]|nr:S8 family serine peptidase [Holophagales bacterium]
MSIVFSVGNIRNVDPNRDDLHSEVRSPATAKNAISVGASGLATWDILAVPCQTAISIRDVPSLSRRSVAYGSGRIKPDLVAPGRSTVSTRSYSGAESPTARSTTGGSPTKVEGPTSRNTGRASPRPK